MFSDDTGKINASLISSEILALFTICFLSIAFVFVDFSQLKDLVFFKTHFGMKH